MNITINERTLPLIKAHQVFIELLMVIKIIYKCTDDVDDELYNALVEFANYHFDKDYFDVTEKLLERNK